jgi:RimJ/RimL family protein N-acetyltransferase
VDSVVGEPREIIVTVPIRVVETTESLIAGFHAAVDAVARERSFLAFLEAPPLSTSEEFVHRVVSGGGVHLVAIDADDRVVGWCDILRNRVEGFRHAGQFGIGVIAAYRGAGLGRRLAEAAIKSAWERELERIALVVFASNVRAIALYQRLGFEEEGVRRRARKLDGNYDDELMMALLRKE